MASPPRQALLRVVSGPHAGAELLLSEGANSLGSDDHCDIVLADPGLAPRHAVLMVAGGVVTLEQTGDRPVYVDGQPVTKQQLRPYQVITVGDTAVAVGPSNEPWPALTAPSIAPPTVEPERLATAPVSDATAVVAPAPGAHASGSPGERNPSRRRSLFAVVVAALVLLAFLLLWNPFGETPVAATQGSQDELKQQINTILKKFGDSSDLKLDDRAKPLTVTGYVPNAEVRKELGAALGPVKANVRITVAETAALAEAAGRVLKMHKVDFKTAPGKPGEVIVSGVTTDLGNWRKLKTRLATDVPKIRTLTDRVTLPNQPRPASNAVTPEPPAPMLSQRPADVPTGENSAETANGVPPVPTAVTLAIRSITIGQSKALVLESGERVFEGATLPGGYVVKSISAESVVLERMGERSVVSVGVSK